MNHIKGLFCLIVALMLGIQFVNAQERCYSHILMLEDLQSNPNFVREQNKLEAFTRKNQLEKDQSGSRYIIPTVFHVIHDGDALGTGDNLPASLILAQLSQLNQDFGKENSNADQTPAVFQDVAADTDIEFCLATKTPGGATTSGITRTHISTLGVLSSDCWDPEYIRTNIMMPLMWDHLKYLNVFIIERIDVPGCSSSGQILGFAAFPGSAAGYDGIVVINRSIGALETPNPVSSTLSFGRTTTHEVGHWLNLRHIGGDVAGGCGDDFVSDTPPQKGGSSQNGTGNDTGQNYGCPTHPLTYPGECPGTTAEMFMNYMDYVDDQCMTMFSNGQKNRMRSVIEGSRVALKFEKCCARNPVNRWTGPPVGDWYGTDTHWSLQRTPMPCDIVIIPSGKRLTIKNGETALGYELRVNAGGQYVVEDGGVMCIDVAPY